MKKESTEKTVVEKRKQSVSTKKTKKKKPEVSKAKVDTKAVKKKEEKPIKKKTNIFKAIGNWFKEEVEELKKVSWPTKREVFKNFIATVLCVIFLGLLFYAIDIIMVWLKTVVI